MVSCKIFTRPAADINRSATWKIPSSKNLKRIFNNDEDAEDLRLKVKRQIKDRLDMLKHIENEVKIVTTRIND